MAIRRKLGAKPDYPRSLSDVENACTWTIDYNDPKGRWEVTQTPSFGKKITVSVAEFTGDGSWGLRESEALAAGKRHIEKERVIRSQVNRSEILKATKNQEELESIPGWGSF